MGDIDTLKKKNENVYSSFKHTLFNPDYSL